MNNKAVISLLIVSLLLFSACELVKGIFNAGFWTGIIVVALIIGLIIYFIAGRQKK